MCCTTDNLIITLLPDSFWHLQNQDLMDLIQLPNTDQMKNTYKGERIWRVPGSRGTGRERQALRRKQWSHTAVLSSCWPQGIRPLVFSSKLAVQLGFSLLCFTLEAGGGYPAWRSSWQHEDCEREIIKGANVQMWQIRSSHVFKPKEECDPLRFYWENRKRKGKGKDFCFKRQIEVII